MRVIIDNGACSSGVGKNTLDHAMKYLRLTKVENTDIMLRSHRFGNYEEDQPSICAVRMPFRLKSNDENDPLLFHVAFDVIDGNLPFLLGLPSLISMGASINHKNFTIAFHLSGQYTRLKLDHDGDHM